MEIIKIIKSAVGLFLALVLLIGCSSERDVRLTYSDKAFECELSWDWNGIRYRGTLTAGDIADRDAMERDISLTFAEPDSLRGVRAEKVDGKIKVYADEIVFSSNEKSGWLSIAELFRTDGKISETSLAELGGEQTNCVTMTLSNGEKLQIYLSATGGIPMRICGIVNGKDTQADIIRFDVKSPRE